MKTFEWSAKGVRPYTTGAFVLPVKITNDDGRVWHGWMIDCFNDDTFLNGEQVSIEAVADTEEGLLPQEEDDDTE